MVNTLVVLSLIALLTAQDPSRKQVSDDDEAVIKIKSELVLIDVTVLDRNNKLVRNLDRSQFQVYEDQIQQNIEFFSQEEVPISYGIVIDTSGSMRRRLSTVIQAAKLLVSLSKPGDEIFIVDMKDSQNIELVEEFTPYFEDAIDALDNMVAGGGTSLLDGIVVSAEYATKGKNRRKALVVISDGDERDSTYTVEETLDKIREYDVQLYLIGFPDDLSEDAGLFKRSPKKRAIELINKLAAESGGQAYFPKELSEIEAIAQRIASDLRSQYTIGYYPTNQRLDGSFRKIQVKLLNSKDLVVRTRSGYYAAKATGSSRGSK
ncbi:MAG: VWA domain-containing protein [Acidobacteriota bacterium]|nr:VWA domain-containing protein [Blastocatellia bacterium]MDW8413677.1 VWA domain-containing protein [Acidobacteriota bacterium]